MRVVGVTLGIAAVSWTIVFMLIGAIAHGDAGCVIFALLVTTLLYGASRLLDRMGRRLAPGMCLRCGYDLRGNIAARTCPECGKPLTRRELSRSQRAD